MKKNNEKEVSKIVEEKEEIQVPTVIKNKDNILIKKDRKFVKPVR